MPKRIAALAAVLVLTLTGCAGVTEDAGDDIPAPAVTVTETPSAPPVPTETPESAPVATNPTEESFLGVVISDLAGEEATLTEREALDAGYSACEQIAALPEGATIIDRYNIKPLPGSSEGANSVIVREAIAHFCP